MNVRIKEYFKDVCIRTSELSTCVSKQVGCLLIIDKRIIAMSYNGVPSGVKHCNEMFNSNNFDREEHHDWSHLNENHAEQNLVSFCANKGISMMNGSLIISISPCIHCAKLLLNTGLKEVIYLNEYDKDISGIRFLQENGLRCMKYDIW